MTFEEFFKKKRIDLAALQSGEPGLYSEFEKHFNQMGEKSFDHTKKYWFNKLRLLYHLAPELKPEKVHIENQLAEQTITESLLEERIAAPSVGFKPRLENVESETLEVETPEQATTKPVGFAPRFKAGVTKPKPADEVKGVEEVQKVDEVAEPEQATPKPAGFTPRFKAGVTKAVPVAVEMLKVDHEAKDVSTETESSVDAAPKPAGFKPRFNMKMVAPKLAEGLQEAKQEEEPKPAVETPGNPTEEPAAKPAGFKPRFNAKMMKPKPPEEEK